MERLNKENQDPYVTSTIIKDHQCDVYMDDYGQCYYFEYLDDNNEIQSVGCGTYNFNYYEEMISYFDIKGYYYSTGQEEDWKESMKKRAERGLPSIDYDDYDVYDIEGFYERLG